MYFLISSWIGNNFSSNKNLSRMSLMFSRKSNLSWVTLKIWKTAYIIFDNKKWLIPHHEWFFWAALITHWKFAFLCEACHTCWAWPLFLQRELQVCCWTLNSGQLFLVSHRAKTHLELLPSHWLNIFQLVDEVEDFLIVFRYQHSQSRGDWVRQKTFFSYVVYYVQIFHVHILVFIAVARLQYTHLLFLNNINVTYCLLFKN